MFASVPNVHVVNWFDQKAVLEHPKVKAFMTHCGLNSINEAALAAVPMIGMPLFADQLYNAAIMVNKGIGVHVPIESTNDPQVLIEALDKVLNQPKYKENAKVLQKKLKISPFKPEEKFVKWVEFAAEFPNLNELNLPFDELVISSVVMLSLAEICSVYFDYEILNSKLVNGVAIMLDVEKLLQSVEVASKSGAKKEGLHLIPIVDVAIGSIINHIIFGFRFHGKTAIAFRKLRELTGNLTKLFEQPVSSVVVILPWLRYFLSSQRIFAKLITNSNVSMNTSTAKY
uniref:UDP-glucuronosyltransferase n=1 Tax=Ditylenchus dipsaci TaxID=166011 RepID=A0A915DLF0_9BILA